MGRFQVEPFQEHDEVWRSGERGVIQMRQNRETREWFPVVIVQTGQNRGKSEYPRRGWRVQLDHNGGTVTRRCPECEREFKRPLDSTEIFCVQCLRRCEEREKDRAVASTTRNQAHDDLKRPWRE